MLILSSDVNDGDDRIEPFDTIVDPVFPLFDVASDSNDNSEGNW